MSEVEKDDLIHDYKSFRNLGTTSFKEFWDFEKSFAQNIATLLPKFVILPNAKLQIPVVASYFSHYSPLCTVLPILFCVGQAGSGKSTIGMLASEIFNCQPLNASSSPASIRNEVTRLRFKGEGEEKAYCLIWDDVKANNFLEQPVIYSIFRSGYNRKTDMVTIAGAEGTNMVYRVFGGRITSSIEPIFNHPKMSELQRRTLPVACKQFCNFSRDEAIEAGILDDSWTIEDKYDLDDFDFAGINELYLEHWKSHERLNDFSMIKRRLGSSKKLKDRLGKNLTISKDLIATAVSSGLFESLDDAVEIFAQYWETVAAKQFSDLSATAQIVKAYIDEILRPVREKNSAVGYALIPEVISPNELKAMLTDASKKGELDTFLTPQSISAVMSQLGWKLKRLESPSPITGMNWVHSVE